MRVVKNTDYPDTRDALSHEWQHFFNAICPEIIPIPLLNDPKNIVKWVNELDLDGVIFSNGNDMNSCPVRDETESSLFNFCMKNEKTFFEIRFTGVRHGLETYVFGFKPIGVLHAFPTGSQQRFI